ncbi:hypothetical protein QSJ18_13395 [Gordonia sp. ABSL1-1]|uniref:hypothetical protein n=1 Tax=Gordonia sp. ABSL1-1 TaxID=3053923 RepID=UPI0025740711|nr:hypothetical protein [Gordonia sp. ABSL1-1]MDL9937742.1 hypothetical protein [Gordonia sp. ABSL1-1]
MLSPQTFDQRWHQLIAVSSARGYVERQPLEEHLLADADGSGAWLDTIQVALAAMQSRLAHLCSSDTSDENLWLIAGLIHQQMLVPDDYRREHLYRLLTIVSKRDITQITAPDAVALLDLVWALRLPVDPEKAREATMRDWLNEDFPESLQPPSAVLVETLVGACPPDWQRINGTVTLASGQVLTDLTVTTPDAQPAHLNQVFAVPETISWRAADGNTWWRLHVDISHSNFSVAAVDESTPPDPQQLLRQSDFHAEQQHDTLPADAPEWLRTYCDNGTIDYGDGPRLVIGTAEAIDIVRREAVERGIGAPFDTDLLAAVRLPVGYRVFMYQPPDTPFGDLILDAPRFYVGDDGRIYPARAANPVHANDEFRFAYAERHGYQSTIGGTPWPSRAEAIVGPRKS